MVTVALSLQASGSHTPFASVAQALYYDKEIPEPFYAPTGAFVRLIALADDIISRSRASVSVCVPFVAGSFVQMVNLTACGTSLPHYHPGVTEINYVLEGRI